MIDRFGGWQAAVLDTLRIPESLLREIGRPADADDAQPAEESHHFDQTSAQRRLANRLAAAHTPAARTATTWAATRAAACARFGAVDHVRQG